VTQFTQTFSENARIKFTFSCITSQFHGLVAWSWPEPICAIWWT